MRRIYTDYDQEKTIKNIRLCMELKHYTVKDISWILDVGITTVYNWFNGVNYISAVNQRKLALVFGKPVEEIFELKEEFINEFVRKIKSVD